MELDLIFKIGAMGLLLAVLNIVLGKAGREDIAQLATIIGVVIVLFMVINEVSALFESIRSIFNLYQ